MKKIGKVCWWILKLYIKLLGSMMCFVGIGNYFYNGIGHFTVQYEKVLAIGFEGIIKEAEAELAKYTVAEAADVAVANGANPLKNWQLIWEI